MTQSTRAPVPLRRAAGRAARRHGAALVLLGGLAVAPLSVQARGPALTPAAPAESAACIANRGGVLLLSSAPACRTETLAFLRSSIAAMNELDETPRGTRAGGYRIRSYPLHRFPAAPGGGPYFGQR
jgi:hypothetical protein